MKRKFSTQMIVTMFTIISLVACKKDNPPADNGNDVKINSSNTFGQYITNKKGETLYFFANDADGLNTCTGGCEAVWPVFYSTLTNLKLDAGLDIADFAEITTSNGKKQLTYKGWPLYTYSPASTSSDGYGGSTTSNKPEAPGQITGDGVGGVWFVGKPDYTIMLANKQLTGKDGKNYTSLYVEGTGKTLYFTNAKGRTLFIFTKDKMNINTFTKSDFSNNTVWPIYEQNKFVVPSTLDKSLFGSINVFGKTQITYKGWPLYYFGEDVLRGKNTGVSVPTPGVWPVAVRDLANPPN
ncbi:MAG: hypothetical protein KGZ74_00815 [Chitinophagaceae bacterium]|nr:hypothetical protein [Chitinophagaceae bacterium]